MIVVDVFGISVSEPRGGYTLIFEIDAQVTFYDENKSVLGQSRGDFIIKGDDSLTFSEAGEAIKEMFRRSIE